MTTCWTHVRAFAHHFYLIELFFRKGPSEPQTFWQTAAAPQEATRSCLKPAAQLGSASVAPVTLDPQDPRSTSSVDGERGLRTSNTDSGERPTGSSWPLEARRGERATERDHAGRDPQPVGTTSAQPSRTERACVCRRREETSEESTQRPQARESSWNVHRSRLNALEVRHLQVESCLHVHQASPERQTPQEIHKR